MASAPAKPLSNTDSRVEIVSDSLAMGVIFAMVLTILGRAIGFVRGILFCYLMTEQQLGQWSMVWSSLMTLAPFAVLGLPGCFGRFVEHYRLQGQMGAFVKRIAMVSAVSTLSLSAAVLIFPEVFSWLVFREVEHVGIIRMVGVSLVLVTALNFSTSLMESLRQVRIVTVMRFVLGVVFAVVGCSLLWAWEDAASAATLAYGIASVAAMAPAAWFLWKRRSSFVDSGEKLAEKAMWVRLAPFAMWLWLANLFNNLFETSDRYMLIHWSPESAEIAQKFVGQYHSGRIVPLLLVSVATILGGILMPYFSAAWEKGRKEKVHAQVNWSVKIVLLSFTAGGLAVLIGSPILFDWVFQGRYDDGLEVLPMTMVYCTFYSAFVLSQEYLWVREKGLWAFGIVAVALIANVGLNMALIPLYGLWGAVFATTIANALTLVLGVIVNHAMGCRIDLGLVVCAALPLVLLLPIWGGLLASFVGVFVAAKTRLVFNDREKSELGELASKGLAKVTSCFAK